MAAVVTMVTVLHTAGLLRQLAEAWLGGADAGWCGQVMAFDGWCFTVVFYMQAMLSRTGRAAMDVDAWAKALNRHVPVATRADASGQLQQGIGRLNKAATRLLM